MKKVLVLLVAITFIFGVVAGSVFVPEQVQAETEFTEDDF